MEAAIDLAHYLSEQTLMPMYEVMEIYQTGAPWPIIFKELERTAQEDAQASGCPVETTRKALDQLCDIEGAQLKALAKDAERAVVQLEHTVPFFELPKFHTILDQHPFIQDMWQYSARVAVRVGGTETWKVFAVYLALLQYAWEHPEWAGSV